MRGRRSLPLDELTAQTGEKVLYVQGEINVSNAGPIRVQLDSAAGAGSGSTRHGANRRGGVRDHAGPGATRSHYASIPRRGPTRYQSGNHQTERVAGRVHGGRWTLGSTTTVTAITFFFSFSDGFTASSSSSSIIVTSLRIAKVSNVAEKGLAEIFAAVRPT